MIDSRELQSVRRGLTTDPTRPLISTLKPTSNSIKLPSLVTTVFQQYYKTERKQDSMLQVIKT